MQSDDVATNVLIKDLEYAVTVLEAAYKDDSRSVAPLSMA